MILQCLTVIYVLVCLAMIGLVLMQRGKGADIGASMGGGASNTIFGSQGSANFLSRSTAWLAVLFYVLCLLMTALTYRQTQQDSFNLVPTSNTEVDPSALPE